MTVMLGYDSLAGLIGMAEAIDLLEVALGHEGRGNTFVSPKTVADFTGGSLRMLMAADYEAGYFATKAYNLTRGAGARYVVSLYRLSDGELLALLDGQVITDLRTGAASGVIARRTAVAGPVTVGVVGSGNQARTQLESLAAAYPVEQARVYSPNAGHREAFAAEMSARLGIPVRTAGSVEEAVQGCPVVATASGYRGSDPLVRRQWLDRCRLLCAVGNTRTQFMEIDVPTFRDAALVCVDSVHAFEEAGELRAALQSGAIGESKQATLAEVVGRAVSVPQQGLVVFKSVGTALQDLALSVRCYELLQGRPGNCSAPDLAVPRRAR